MAEKFNVGWLYPDLMNIYGDRGNIVTLLKRTQWRGYDANLVELPRGVTKGMDEVDVFFFGGGQDREQSLVYEDLLEYKQPLIESAVASGAMILAVCGGYQLLGHYYRTADGQQFPGIGLIDAHTDAGPRRLIGDVVVDIEGLSLDPPNLVGFENHSGRTFLGPKAAPLGKVRLGSGNNGEDGTEGCVQGAVIGTYLHGSLLPKNPQLADHLIGRALKRRGVESLSALDDAVELEAHARILERERQRRAPAAGPARLR